MNTNKKKIIIILCIILLAFLITFLFIIHKNHSKKQVADNITTEQPKQSSTESKDDDTVTGTNNESITTKDYENSFKYIITDETGDSTSIICMNIKSLTPEQSADKESLVEKVNNYSKSKKKSIEQIDIDSDMSNDEQIYAKASYVDGDSEDIVILYDKYKTHGFMRCVNKEEYEIIESGGCAG